MTLPPSVLQAMAKASAADVYGPEVKWENLDEECRQSYLDDARIQANAIEDAGYCISPLEPSREMTMAGSGCLPSCEHVFGHAGKLCANVYEAMLTSFRSRP